MVKLMIGAGIDASAIRAGRGTGSKPRAVAPFEMTAPGLTGSGRIGTAVLADMGVWGGEPPPSLSVRWQRDGADIAGAAGASYTPGPADDLSALRCVVTAVNATGTLAVASAALTVTWEPPVSSGGLLDEIHDQDSGVQLIPTAYDFTGGNLSFSVSGAGAAIDPQTGVVSLPTDVLRSGESVTVTAMNSGGTAQSAFPVTVEDSFPGGAMVPPALVPASLRATKFSVSLGPAPDAGGAAILGYDLRYIGFAPDAPGQDGGYLLVTGAGPVVDIFDLQPGGTAQVETRAVTDAGAGPWSAALIVDLPAADGPVFADSFAAGPDGANVSARLPEAGAGWMDFAGSNLKIVSASAAATHAGTGLAVGGSTVRASLFDGGYWAGTRGELAFKWHHAATSNRVHAIVGYVDDNNLLLVRFLSNASGGNVTIISRVAGVDTVIASRNSGVGAVFNDDLPGGPHEMRVMRVEDTIRVLVDGSEILQATDAIHTGTLWGAGGGGKSSAQMIYDAAFTDQPSLAAGGQLPASAAGALSLTYWASGTRMSPAGGGELVEWTAGFDDYMGAAAACITETGKTYRAACTVDTSGIPAGTPVQLRAMRSAQMQDDPARAFATDAMLGQDVVYADGTVQDLDMRWTDWTGNGVCYVGVLVMQPFDRNGSNPLKVPGIAGGQGIIVSDLTFAEHLDTLHGATGTVSTTNVRRHGVELTFNQPATVRKYANGDFHILRAPGLQVVSSHPPCKRWNFDVDGTNLMTPAAGDTMHRMVLHGMEKNPWKAGWEEAANKSDASSPNIAAFEDRFRMAQDEGAAYSDAVLLPVKYDGAFNIDPGNTGAPVDIDADMTLTKALSFIEPLDQPGQGRRRLASYSHFTFTDKAPAAGDFRPFPGAADKTPTHNASEADTSILPELAIPGAVQPEDTFTYAQALQIARIQPSPQVRTNPTYIGSTGALGTGVYGRATAAEMSERFYAPLICDTLTQSEKDDIATGMVQYGLDVYACNNLRNQAWSHGGATPPIKQAPVLAAMLLDDQAMKDTLIAGSFQFDVRDNPALPAASRRFPYTFDGLSGLVVAENATVPRDIYIEAAGKNYQMRAAMVYFPENIGMPALMDTAKPVVPWDVDGNPDGQNTWKAAYRLIGKSQGFLAMLAMHAVPGARAVYGNDATLDWFDMAFRYLLENRDRVTSTERLGIFQEEMWKAHRSSAPVPVSRFGLDDETSVSAAEIVTLFGATYDAEFAVKFPDVQPPEVLTEARVKGGAVEGVPRIRVFAKDLPVSFPLEPEWFGDPARPGTSLLAAATRPASYALVSGTLPAGLALNASTGVIEGTATEQSPLRGDLPDSPETGDSIRATDVVVRAANASGSSEQLIRFAVGA